MSNPSQYVLDTNILVSALLFRQSRPRQAFDQARFSGIILLSQSTLSEIQNVLARPKFRKYITVAERDLFLIRLVKIAKLIEIQQTITVCRDSKDNKFLEVAVNGGAKAIITGDQDLLVLHPFNNIAILTVKQFLELE